MSSHAKVVICGAKGYAGQALVKGVIAHPALQLVGVGARQSSQELYEAVPLLAQHHIPIMPIEELNQQLAGVDIVLLATPPEVSMALVSLLTAQAVTIIDLSGAFRLAADEFEQWYGLKHKIPSALADAQYGLSPWHKIKAGLVANPGCYATCALMSLIPLLKENIIQGQSIIIDAKSGVSGAGKKANVDLMYHEMSNNFFPYKVGGHQHVPEINHALTHHGQQTCQVILTTHMLPINSGVAMSIYADVKNDALSDQEIAHAIAAAYTKAYQDYPLVVHHEINQGQLAKDKFILSIKSVVGSAKTHIGYFVQHGKVFVFASLDNLLKGAASQAIENINALLNLPLATGLLPMEVVS